LFALVEHNLIYCRGEAIKKRLHIFVTIIVAVFSLLLAATIACIENPVPVKNNPDSNTKVSEEWLGIYLQGKRVGYSFSKITPSDLGSAIEEISEYTLRMMGEQRTLNAHLYAHTDSTYSLIDFTIELKTTGHATKVEGMIKGSALTLTSLSQGISKTQTIPLTEKLYLPVAVEEILKKTKLK
jgi:hypothetical protein